MQDTGYGMLDSPVPSLLGPDPDEAEHKMWHSNWREQIWARLQEPWDVIVIGGGITGAGILKLAAGIGLRALLVEKRDFAWGTSSRSTKLVHGGLRYLAQGQFGVTRESVHEREQLLRQGPGLIDPLGFLVSAHEGGSPSRRAFAVGLAVYDLFAHKWDHCYYSGDDFLLLAPHVRTDKLMGGFRYRDAVTDDARLVLRVIREAVRAGAAALNYAAVQELFFAADGRVGGVLLQDQVTGQTAQVRARAVINATGAWADQLRQQVGGEARIRPSRGSHLIFPAWRLPVAQAITLVHPRDQRPVFVLPWEGTTVAGTTDLDHHQPLDEEPQTSKEEVEYILMALQAQFPGLRLRADDVLCSFAGLRPIVGSGKGDPSKESRAHVVLREKGLVSVAGGKLTTFRRMALDALEASRDMLPGMPQLPTSPPVLEPVPADVPQAAALPAQQRRRLLGRYGADCPALLAAVRPEELLPIADTPVLWPELRWGARDEGVVHLEDLLLRRVRIGLLLPRGALDMMERIRKVVQSELGWDDTRWQSEVAAYEAVWAKAYGAPCVGDRAASQ